LGLFYKEERKGLAPGASPKVTAKANDVQIKTFTATKLADAYGGRERLQVDVGLSRPALDHYVDVYVSGYYVGVFGELEGLKNVGRRPAYEFIRLGAMDSNQHPAKEPNRRYVFRAPDVLPAKVRVELYQIKQPQPARLVAIKEIGFDLDWNDYGVISGILNGSPDKKFLSGYAVLVHPGTRSVNFRIPAMNPVKPDDFSNDVNVSVRIEEGQTETRKNNYNRTIDWPLNWKASLVTSSPSLNDRDIRNNHYWPYLRGGGYLEIPPIRAGNAPITKYP